MKIQTKITLLFFCIGTAGLLVFHYAIFYFVSDFNFEDFYKRLDTRSKLTAEVSIHPDERSADYAEMRARYLEKMEDEKNYVFKIDSLENPDFKNSIGLPPYFYKNIVENGTARFSRDNMFYYGRLFNKNSSRYIVVVSASDPSGFHELEVLRRALIVLFGVSVLLTYVAGKIFSHYMVRPLTAVIRNVKNISANNLHLRLNELDGKDEMSELVLTFNNMLNRLETAFATQNNFVSNASHELKTPIAIITAELELMLSRRDLDHDTRVSANRALAHAEKLGHIITSLLGLAQTGFDGKKQNWQKIRIDELVLTVADSVKKIVPDSVIHIDFSLLPGEEEKLCTEGNVNLLQLAVSNIVINACKYSNNQPVEIRIIAENERIAIAVTDKGIGIPLKEQQYIFEPFFRASNTGHFQGHGIGLPLTLNIIRLHNGSIGIRSEEEVGTEMQIILPVCRSFC
ncbi:HAMP domain-containing sensor histidine kinase [Pedobacter deserti]|uniref:HAMP domain-containing sensor histidine kinase n=1 Tax=Pedobacter deserti TaxID=2817382 RepID=UPI00210EA309|nr:HAMP domain-containing sensor histidine kinase [Pedobacter sp. SYSU D00382]